MSDVSSEAPHAATGGDVRRNLNLALALIAAAQLMVVLDGRP